MSPGSMRAMSDAGRSPAAFQSWLKARSAVGGRPGRLAAALTVIDVVPAAAFAAGLAMAVAGAADGNLARTGGGLVLVVGALAVRAGLAQAAVVAGARAARAVRQGVRGEVLSGLFGRTRAGAAGISAASEGVDALDGYVARYLPARTAAVVAPLAAIGLVALASPVASAILLFTLLPFAAGMALAGMAAAEESRRQFAALQALSGLFIDRVRALPTVRAYDAVGRVTAEVAHASDALARRTGKVLRIAFLSSGVLEFFSALSVALVAVYCGFNLLRLLPFPVPEQLDLARALFVLALAPEVYAPMRRLAAAYHDRQAGEAAAPVLMSAGAPAEAGAGPTLARAPRIRFSGATIAYGDAAPVLSAFDLDIAPGEIVALTGASGSGKSSLLHVLLGLAPLRDGEVTVDDLQIDGGVDLAGRVAWASQSPVVTPGSLADNIALADRAASPGRIAAAARQAGLTGDLARRLDERGGGLSGGERRRLALARAFLSTAPLLLLDEPTANLDPRTEAGVVDVLRRVARGRTTLVATHSAAVIALADREVRL